MNDNDKFSSGIGDPTTDIAARVAVAAAGGMLDGIKQTGGDVWGGIVGDRIKLWRIQRFCVGLKKTAAKLDEMGIPIEKAKPLPYGEMLAIFDGMSKADEDNLSELWANLLAEAMSNTKASGLSKKSAALILEQMSSNVARIFIILAKEEKSHEIRRLLGIVCQREIIPLAEEHAELDEANLSRELENIREEVRSEWRKVLGEERFGHEDIDVIKGELLRLSLIETQRDVFYFDSNPFRRGYQVNHEGLDSVLSDLHDSIYELVDSRTDQGTRPLIKVDTEYRFTNFRLNGLGRSLARVLALI